MTNGTLSDADLIALFNRGFEGDFDITQVEKNLALTPTERYHLHESWRTALMSNRTIPEFSRRLAERLNAAGVEYLFVGGVAGILHGADLVTKDTDICFRRTPENHARLAEALKPLAPKARGLPPELPFVFDEATLALGCNFTLTVGPESLDLLGMLSAVGGYENLAPRSLEVELDGTPVRIMSLADLIASKEAANRPKDHAVLPELRELLRRQQAGST